MSSPERHENPLALNQIRFRYPWLLGGAYVMNLATAASALTIPPLMGNAIDQALTSGLGSRVLLAGAAILVA